MTARVPAREARRHLRRLHDSGVGLRAVAGQSHRLGLALLRGVAAGRVRELDPEVAAAILSVRADSGPRVPAGPTLERVARLQAAGRSLRTINLEALGARSGRPLRLGQEWVRADTAAAIARYAEEVLGPDTADGRAAVPFGVVHPPDVPRSWFDDGACRSRPPEEYFPPEETPEAARAACAGCPVVGPCLTWALANDEWGIWGATTRAERDAMDRQAVSA